MATETTEAYPETGFYWHRSHDILLEWCTSYTERRKYIQREKPPQEQELRLRLFRPVRASLPGPLIRASAELVKASAEWNRNRADPDKDWAEVVKTSWAKLDKAGAEWNKARAESLPQIETIHQVECPNCPWNGHSIFPS